MACPAKQYTRTLAESSTLRRARRVVAWISAMRSPAGEQRMSSTIMDFRVREEMAGAVLKEVAALEPAERVQEADSLKQIMVQAVQGLEVLWADLRDPLERGVSPSQAVALGR